MAHYLGPSHRRTLVIQIPSLKGGSPPPNPPSGFLPARPTATRGSRQPSSTASPHRTGTSHLSHLCDLTPLIRLGFEAMEGGQKWRRGKKDNYVLCQPITVGRRNPHGGCQRGATRWGGATRLQQVRWGTFHVTESSAEWSSKYAKMQRRTA